MLERQRQTLWGSESEGVRGDGGRAVMAMVTLRVTMGILVVVAVLLMTIHDSC